MAKNEIKPFLTYEEQLNNLEEKKNMILTNRAFAMSKLQDISYYALIDGYKNLFYNPMTRKYYEGTTFEDVVALYNFDEKLRALVFRYLCHVEQKIRSLISYHFCDTYSEKQEDYLDIKNYNCTRKNRKGIEKLIEMLSIEANKNMNHPYVVYQRNTYGNVPLWVMMKTLTFGQISKMYSFFTTSIQSKISTNYPEVSEREMMQYLRVLTHFRNVCAHNERLLSFRCRLDIPDTVLHKKMKISQTGTHYDYGKNDLFAIVIALRFLLNHEEFIEFKRDLSQLISQLMKQSESLTKETLLEEMGFPENWNNITRYSIIKCERR